MGVRLAVQRAEETSALQDAVYSLGPLIHNPQEVSRLQAEGIQVADSLEEVASGTVIIRAHGAPPDTYASVADQGLGVVDATCPFVFSLQKKAVALAEEGYQVVIVGDPTHPEVVGVIGWIGGRGFVVAKADDVDRLPPLDRVGVVAQTTQREDVVEAVVVRLLERAREVRVEHTICRATTERQDAARDLAQQVEVVVVVGGTTSSNTQKLASICRDAGARAYHVEKASDLCPEWFQGIQRAGVTAGASTPDWIVKEVIGRMEELTKEPSLQGADQGDQGQGPAVDTVSAAPVAGSVAVEELPGEAPAGSPAGEADGDGARAMQEGLDMKTPRQGQVVEGTIVQVNADHLLVDVGYKSDGIVAFGEISLLPGQQPADAFQVGQRIPVVVLGIDAQEGTLKLSQRRAREREAWKVLEKSFQDKETLELPVAEVVKGGLVLDAGVRAFMPASHVERGFVEDLSAYVGRTMRCRIIEMDRPHRKLIVSQKAILEEERGLKRQEVWTELEEGQVRTGVVKGITDYGAFVDLGGVDGLLHVSEMAWNRVNHPSEILREGQEIQVKVLRLDREKSKISLGLKQIQANPWVDVEARYPVGETFEGKVVRTVPFGAFVEIEPGVEGLVHISQLADRHVADVHEVVKEGDRVTVRVLKVSPEDRRISLSMREPEASRSAREPHDPRERAPREGRGRGPREARQRAPRPENQTVTGEPITRESATLGEMFGDLLEETKERLNGRHG